MPHTEYKLIEEIVKLSEANNWESAKGEWVLDFIEKLEPEDEPETCLCSHFPIKELCHIRNKFNGRETIVGNVCVTKFLGIDSDSVFASLRRIMTDGSKAISGELASYAMKRGLITEWEYGFCMNTRKKRNLSENQLFKRKEINRRLINKIKRKMASFPRIAT